MIKVTTLNNLSTLPITTTLQEQIKSILTEPFHDDAETQQAWDELQCELWFLTSITDLNSVVVDDIELLKRALTYTEFEDDLDYGASISLSIVEDSGKGLYLLMPKTLRTELHQHFSISDE
ncbi:conserved hypothetical protein [Vibrio crassostreae]|uniref:hypothetical protein n=1 Tax=Vibrio lentus TaxID=136468 RepID=UPI000C8223E4|nr:hypothetical protein [Vibrio lentus]CAK2124632.1 conserved hypothetical protein [Vibrio crassostreae]CAK2126948.1 conserved hypothetical protein [Vibrio crassostreae]CAK2132738.1 conserved hypothetical protein [Vibrio crassostreae]CAK2133314.1 conserved hypothetical protein [Vibrio crassostreae]CAK2136902.1 conserved hypothetical protein [Vibrio crassostreae]